MKHTIEVFNHRFFLPGIVAGGLISISGMHASGIGIVTKDISDTHAINSKPSSKNSELILDGTELLSGGFAWLGGLAIAALSIKKREAIK